MKRPVFPDRYSTPLQLHTLYSCYAVRQIWRYTGASRIYILLDCTLEFCRAI